MHAHTDTHARMRACMQDVTGIPIAEQTIFYEPHSTIDGLTDAETLSFFGVPPSGNAVLRLNPWHVKLKFKDLSGKTTPINVGMTDTMGDIKRKLLQTMGGPGSALGDAAEPQDISLFFSGPKGYTEVTVGDMIDNDIPEGSTLLVNPIVLHPEGGDAFAVDISVNDSVQLLKERAQEHYAKHYSKYDIVMTAEAPEVEPLTVNPGLKTHTP